MTLPDGVDEERKKTEAGIHRSDIEEEIQNLGQDIHRISRGITEEFKKVQDARSDSPSEPAP